LLDVLKESAAVACTDPKVAILVSGVTASGGAAQKANWLWWLPVPIADIGILCGAALSLTLIVIQILKFFIYRRESKLKQAVYKRNLGRREDG